MWLEVCLVMSLLYSETQLYRARWPHTSIFSVNWLGSEKSALNFSQFWTLWKLQIESILVVECWSSWIILTTCWILTPVSKTTFKKHILYTLCTHLHFINKSISTKQIQKYIVMTSYSYYCAGVTKYLVIAYWHF